MIGNLRDMHLQDAVRGRLLGFNWLTIFLENRNVDLDATWIP